MATSLDMEQRKDLHDLLTSIPPDTLRNRLLEISKAHEEIAQLLYKHLVVPDQIETITTSEDEDRDSEVEILAVKSNDNLVTGKRSHPITISDLADEESMTAERAKGKRSKTETFANCTNCSKLFPLEENREGDCVYHDGYLEADDERIHDNDDFEVDEETHGPFDNEGNREDWPEYFIWDCCDKDGTTPGCEQGKHSILGEQTHYAKLKHGGFKC